MTSETETKMTEEVETVQPAAEATESASLCVIAVQKGREAVCLFHLKRREKEVDGQIASEETIKTKRCAGVARHSNTENGRRNVSIWTVP